MQVYWEASLGQENSLAPRTEAGKSPWGKWRWGRVREKEEEKKGMHTGSGEEKRERATFFSPLRSHLKMGVVVGPLIPAPSRLGQGLMLRLAWATSLLFCKLGSVPYVPASFVSCNLVLMGQLSLYLP